MSPVKLGWIGHSTLKRELPYINIFLPKKKNWHGTPTQLCHCAHQKHAVTLKKTKYANRQNTVCTQHTINMLSCGKSTRINNKSTFIHVCKGLNKKLSYHLKTGRQLCFLCSSDTSYRRIITETYAR